MSVHQEHWQASAYAPGRVNLIGEHTDYNGGRVLPLAIGLATRVQLSKREGDLVQVESTAPGCGELSYRVGEEARKGDWSDYVTGVTARLRAAGHPVRGFAAHVESNLPLGSGLSSSASFTVALLRGLRMPFSLPLHDMHLALLAQEVETIFVGAPVGLMDSMVVSLGDEHAALLMDMSTLYYERVVLPPLDLVIVDSGVHHAHATGGYAERRRECEEAARLLGVAQLCELTDSSAAEGLPAPLAHRARHVISENQRVLAAVRAIRDLDIEALGALFSESHRSLQNDFQVTVPEVDALVGQAMTLRGVRGARMTGGGFGGAIIALADPDAGAIVAQQLMSLARERGLSQTRLLLTAGYT
jgi:galactokinase